MNHLNVLKRAWHIVWNYRALWVFGIILALVTAGGAWSGGNYGGGSGGGNGGPSPEYEIQGGEIHWPEIPPHVVTWLIVAGIALACLVLLLIVAATVARYVAETALIQMVDRYEETGEKLSVRQGFRLGWSRTALRLFLIDLLIALPTAAAFILIFLLPIGLILLSILSIEKFSVILGVIGIVAAIGLIIMAILLAIVVATALRALMHFFRRACALEQVGVLESIRRGFGVATRHWQDALIMWFIMIGIQIGWKIALLVITIALFPIIILLILIGGVLGGLPALLVYGLANLFLDGAIPWILAGVVGLPIFALVMAAPWLFLGGLMEIFKSSVWTLTYRELRALESVSARPETLTDSIAGEEHETS